MVPISCWLSAGSPTFYTAFRDLVTRPFSADECETQTTTAENGLATRDYKILDHCKAEIWTQDPESVDNCYRHLYGQSIIGIHLVDYWSITKSMETISACATNRVLSSKWLTMTALLLAIDCYKNEICAPFCGLVMMDLQKVVNNWQVTLVRKRACMYLPTDAVT